MLNEFQQAEELKDLELLRDFIPSWVNEKPEPFIPDPVTAVTPPTWNKIRLDNINSDVEGGGTGVNPGSERVICAAWNGSTFVPKIMIPVEGTTFEDP